MSQFVCFFLTSINDEYTSQKAHFKEMRIRHPQPLVSHAGKGKGREGGNPKDESLPSQNHP